MIDFDKFYRDNHKSHLRMIGKIIPDEETVQDIVHEAYARAIRYRRSYNPKRSSERTWFNTILYNTLRDFQRRYKQNLEDQIDVDQFYEEDFFSSIHEHFEFLQRQIDRVRSDKHRKILFLFYILGYSAREIESLEGETNVSNVTTVCNRFKKDMHNFYQVEV